VFEGDFAEMCAKQFMLKLTGAECTEIFPLKIESQTCKWR
jgi:hypothetical protein